MNADLLDPELHEGAVRMRESMAAFAPMTRATLPERRAWQATMAPPPLPEVAVERVAVPRADGPDVPVYVVNAMPGTPRPGIVHIHGGGFVTGSATTAIRSVQQTAAALDCPIVTVDYRLAPETGHAGSLDDTYAALLWTIRNAGRIGLDPGRVALLGESAGGGHAALLAVRARDRGEVRVACQALIYPMLDDRTGSTRRLPDHVGRYGWTEEANRFGWQCFLGMAPGGDDVPACAVPARIGELRGLPPTFIAVGALDLLVLDSMDYATRLLTAGVPTELLVVPGAFHGFDMVVREAAVSRRFTAAKHDALRRALGLA